MKKHLILTGYLIMFLVSTISFTLMHENVHAEIFSHFGYDPVIDGAYTHAMGFNSQDDPLVSALQLQADIAGYHLMVIHTSLWIMGAFMLIGILWGRT